jgi:zinc protease
LQQLSPRFEDLHHPFPATIFTLDQGLTLVHQYISATPVVVADVWVRAGAIAEPQEWNGMAHFLEHMIFKGSKRLPPGWFDREIENQGGMTNAATSHDYAHFYLTTANHCFKDTFPYLAEILLQAEIPDGEFIRERDVVLEEIRGSYDDPDWISFQTLCETIYQYHPYGRSVLGLEEQLLKYTPNQMRCFHKTFYQPENMTVVMVGGIKEKEALDLVQKYVSNQFGLRSESPVATVEAEPPLIGIRRSEIQIPRLEHSRLSMGWIGPGVDNLQDGFGLDLLSAILAGSSTSRLVQSLREEEHLVLDICSNFSLQQESSLLTVSAWLETEDLEEVEQKIGDRIRQLQNQPISDLELARFKRMLCNDYTFSTETPGQLAGLYGYYSTIAKAEISVTYPYQIKRLQPVDIQRLAKQYLCADNYCVTVLRPC